MLVVATVAIAQSASQTRSLQLVAYSAPREIYTQLAAQYDNAHPASQSIQLSFGASGAQRRAVATGLRADVVSLALEPDMTKLVQSGEVSADWKRQSRFGGLVSRSVVVFVVRKGNPKQITSWSDLIRPGISIVNPSALASGSAKWNTLAAYGSQLAEGKTKAQAQAYLEQFLRHTVVQPDSARAALAAFTGGKGDVLLSYESDAIVAERSRQNVEHVVPAETILIQIPIAVTSDARHAREAGDIVSFLQSAKAQEELGEAGYRPADPSSPANRLFPTPPKLFTIADLGGWKAVNTAFFDPSKGLVAKLVRKLGDSS